MPYACLTIAGSDPSSGAGIQADIRTFDRCGVHPFSVITAITYQSAKEFYGYRSLSGDLENQLKSILDNVVFYIYKIEHRFKNFYFFVISRKNRKIFIWSVFSTQNVKEVFEGSCCYCCGQTGRRYS